MYKLKSVTKKGSKTVVVILEGATAKSTKELKYGKDELQTWAQFKTMVKSEIKNWLTELNYEPAEQDVTADYK